MATRDSAPTGAPIWIELFSSDTDKAVAFYGSLFGWTAESTGEEFGGYILFTKDGSQISGCMKNDGQAGVPDLWSVYLNTDDAKATADEATAHGGGVIVAAMDVGDLGTMAVISDPGGAAIGAWQPREHKGFGLVNEPGAPAWFELHTREYDKSVQFYKDVFTWDAYTMSDTPEFRYTTLGEGDDALAGIMDSSNFLPEGVPSHWQIYFNVADADATLKKITELGGNIVEKAENTPYGRLASATDTTGASFKIMGPTT